MSKLLYCVQIRNTEGRIGDEGYINTAIWIYLHMYSLVLSGLDRIRLGGQDSARRSGYFLVVRNRLVQLVWSRIRLVWSGNYCMVGCWRQCADRNLLNPSEIHPRDRG